MCNFSMTVSNRANCTTGTLKRSFQIHKASSMPGLVFIPIIVKLCAHFISLICGPRSWGQPGEIRKQIQVFSLIQDFSKPIKFFY